MQSLKCAQQTDLSDLVQKHEVCSALFKSRVPCICLSVPMESYQPQQLNQRNCSFYGSKTLVFTNIFFSHFFLHFPSLSSFYWELKFPLAELCPWEVVGVKSVWKMLKSELTGRMRRAQGSKRAHTSQLLAHSILLSSGTLSIHREISLHSVSWWFWNILSFSSRRKVCEFPKTSSYFITIKQ